MVPKPEVMESRGRGLSECDKDFAKIAKPPPSHFSRFCKSSENEHPNIILRIFVCDLGGRVEISRHKNSMKRITQ